MRKKIISLGIEARAWAKQGQLILLGGRRPGLLPEGDRAVVFVHGYGASGPVFDPMRARVERELCLPTLDFTYRSSTPFPEIVADFSALLSELVADGRRLDLVSHSLGGLISRWALQEMDHAHVVDRLVTLATPHAGTRSARLALGPLAKALVPGGPVVTRLRTGRSRAESVQHTALVAGQDLMVTPPSSAAALADADVHWFDGLGHNSLLFDEAVHEAVVSALAAPLAEANTE